MTGPGELLEPVRASADRLAIVGQGRYTRRAMHRFSAHGLIEPCVYILASKRNGALYVGVTSDLPQRVWLHKNGAYDGFTKKYGVRNLVWREFHATMDEAIEREKALKKWRREWKIALIEKANPDWLDLRPSIR